VSPLRRLGDYAGIADRRAWAGILMPENQALTRDEVVDLAEKLGYTEVRTSAGWITLKSWAPYGGYAKALYRFDAKSEAILDVIPEGQVGGLWKVK
jgi:hypothetical protein